MIVYHVEVNGKTNSGEYVKNICKATNLGIHKVRVFTSRSSIHGDNEIPIFREYGKTKKKSLKLFYYMLGWVGILCHFFKNTGLKILHIHWLKFSVLDFIFLSLLKLLFQDLVLVQTVHNALPHEETFYDPIFFKMIYRKFDVLIFHCKRNMQDFEHRFGTMKAQQCIVPHYGYEVKGQKIPSISNRSILFFGYIKRYKGLELLIDVLCRLGKEINFHVTIAGNTEYNIDAVKRKVDDSDIASRVDWKTGWIGEEEIPGLFNSHSIVVLPYSRIDSSGILHLAMSYGKIVVASNIGVFSDVIKDNENGILFTSENAEALYDALYHVLLDIKGHERLGRNAQDNINKEHSIESVGEKIRDIYTNCSKRYSVL